MAIPGIATTGPYTATPETLPQRLGEDKKTSIVNTLESYRKEAQEARRSGLNPRDEKWEANVNLYWNRYDFSNKQDWQAKETMPEVPAYVDRFAAAMKEALVATPSAFYTVNDPADQEHDVTDAIKRMTDAWLSTSGLTPNGQPLGFPAIFEEQMQLGALMATSAVVTWKGDVPGGRVAIETVDPRSVWLDHTYRNLYRLRRTELDKHDLMSMAKATTKGGKPVFDLEQIQQLVSQVAQEQRSERSTLTGIGQETTSARKPIVLDEYIATVLDNDGELVADRGLFVVANEKFLIRGPEKNPFWHGKDWMLFTPLITAPLSPYGRSYMEDFGGVAKTFTKLTNLILDAVTTSALNAFVLVPSMLLDPTQATTGLSPNKTFLLEDGYSAQEFARNLELGSLDPGAVQVWQTLKSELSEAAGINEIGLGQFAPNSRTSATEISATQQSSSAIVRSVAQTVETRFLDPMLDLVWKTGLQHASPSDKRMAEIAGPEMYQALLSRRRELIKRPITFQARGISMLIQRQSQLQSILNIMQIIAQNDNLLQAFMQAIDVNKLIRMLLVLSNIDITDFQQSQREQQIQSIMQAVQQRAAGGDPSSAVQAEMGGVAAAMGVAR